MFLAAVLFLITLLILSIAARINFLKKNDLLGKKISRKKIIAIDIISFLFFLGSAILFFGNFWARGRFPMDNPETVFFTMANQTPLSDMTIFYEAFKYGLISFFSAVVVTFVPLLILKKIDVRGVGVNFFSHKKYFSVHEVHLAISVLLCIFMIVATFITLHLVSHIKLEFRKYQKPVHSEFYEKEYVEPRMENILFPEQKRNLILIFMESMETSYATNNAGGVLEKNLIPNLTRAMTDNINFSGTNLCGGGVEVSGTSWTVAGILSKVSGLPFALSNIEKDIFLPNAVMLTDILNYNGYRQRFLFGSKKIFGSRGLLFETHGEVEIHDIDWYKKNGMLPKDYHVFWGFEDAKLYDFAKYELAELSSGDEPFMLGFLTVDTHMPEGYMCQLCDNDESWQMENVIKCADSQIGQFLEWAKTQSWYEDTTIVIVGDHLFMTGDDTNFFHADKKIAKKQNIDSARRWTNIFINAVPSATATANEKNRTFSAFDIFPTILSAIGCEINNSRLGLGVDLFSGEKTLLERYDVDYVNEELMRKNIFYEKLAGN